MTHTGEKCQKLYDRFGEYAELREYKKIKTWLFFEKWFDRHVQWLWLNEEKDYWWVWLPSGKETNNRLYWKMIAAEIRKSDGEMNSTNYCPYGAWEQAINMWPVDDKIRATEIFKTVKNRIDRAYKYWFE